MDNYILHLQNNTDESMLWKNLVGGDEASYSLLFKKYFPVLVNYGKSLLSSEEKVKDCVQDVFIDIWIYRNSLREDIVVKAYLLASVRKRIARLQKRDRFFRKTTSTECLDFLLEFCIESELIINDETAKKVERLNTVVNNLPSRQKEALHLRYHRCLSVEQTACLLEVNYQSANNLLHRALLKLRRELHN